MPAMATSSARSYPTSSSTATLDWTGQPLPKLCLPPLLPSPADPYKLPSTSNHHMLPNSLVKHFAQVHVPSWLQHDIEIYDTCTRSKGTNPISQSYLSRPHI